MRRLLIVMAALMLLGGAMAGDTLTLGTARATAAEQAAKLQQTADRLHRTSGGADIDGLLGRDLRTADTGYNVRVPPEGNAIEMRSGTTVIGKLLSSLLSGSVDLIRLMNMSPAGDAYVDLINAGVTIAGSNDTAQAEVIADATTEDVPFVQTRVVEGATTTELMLTSGLLELLGATAKAPVYRSDENQGVIIAMDGTNVTKGRVWADLTGATKKLKVRPFNDSTQQWGNVYYVDLMQE